MDEIAECDVSGQPGQPAFDLSSRSKRLTKIEEKMVKRSDTGLMARRWVITPTGGRGQGTGTANEKTSETNTPQKETPPMLKLTSPPGPPLSTSSHTSPLHTLREPIESSPAHLDLVSSKTHADAIEGNFIFLDDSPPQVVYHCHFYHGQSLRNWFETGNVVNPLTRQFVLSEDWCRLSMPSNSVTQSHQPSSSSGDKMGECSPHSPQPAHSAHSAQSPAAQSPSSQREVISVNWDRLDWGDNLQSNSKA
eukprot:GHVN01039887.1.p1 GENE.GHVN01039887.1~~GHVN01039887.1.p1  ORF type:complete len:259 (-),score=84.68 GHVN01039887.1:290-1039(-)